MKRFLILTCLLFACNLLFCEIKWLDAKENDDGITAYALCSTEEEVLQVTHWKDLESHFISYTKEEEAAKQDMYLVVFMNLGTVVYEYHKGTKMAAYYVKTIFE
jgi:hypothetical protein